MGVGVQVYLVVQLSTENYAIRRFIVQLSGEIGETLKLACRVWPIKPLKWQRLEGWVLLRLRKWWQTLPILANILMKCFIKYS
jgi:hypothetical protein